MSDEKQEEVKRTLGEILLPKLKNPESSVDEKRRALDLIVDRISIMLDLSQLVPADRLRGVVVHLKGPGAGLYASTVRE